MHAGEKTQLFGEIDIVVMAPWGHLVLIEVKAGVVQQTPGGLVKQYGNATKSVDMQAQMQHSATRHNLRRASLPDVRLGQLLVLPDQRVELGTERVLAFLLNRLFAFIDVAAQATQTVQATRRLSSGLATWVPRIISPSKTFVIDATAGSGKTQLSLTLIQQTLQAQERVA